MSINIRGSMKEREHERQRQRQKGREREGEERGWNSTARLTQTWPSADKL